MDRSDRLDRAAVLTIYEALIRARHAYGQYQLTGNSEQYFDDIATETNIMSKAVTRIIERNGWAL